MSVCLMLPETTNSMRTMEPLVLIYQTHVLAYPWRLYILHHLARLRHHRFTFSASCLRAMQPQSSIEPYRNPTLNYQPMKYADVSIQWRSLAPGCRQAGDNIL